ncbi:winged helix-turn-helix domain-containing protein [Flavobacterium potami]|uniref:winged helix-turn-helix domain-containing protein n=1 Tax=Flavobacterium potami TaxID=2872310 RepID=UPI001CBDD1E3
MSFGKTENNDFDSAKREVLLRSIGHELLLQSGDSTSRVLPIKKIASNEYQIEFGKDFSFHPDVLVKTIERLLANDPLAKEYIVNVLNSENSSVVYGYRISKDKRNEAVPCRGRIQPKAKYSINIKLKPTNTIENGYLLGSLPFLAFVGFIFVRSFKPQKKLKTNKKSDFLDLGTIQFDPKNRKLIINESTIELTATESRLLHIFALSPNSTIERSQLQKEIWEDEGVIVGRSLDMFISKLRKKLEADPTINIVVIRGKGYKLEINS